MCIRAVCGSHPPIGEERERFEGSISMAKNGLPQEVEAMGSMVAGPINVG